MRLTNRDIEVIEFLKEFKVLSTSNLVQLFGFNQPNAHRRMKQLMQEFKDIKKMDYIATDNFYSNNYKSILKNENVYYWKRKSKSVQHDLLINNFYLTLMERTKDTDMEVIEFKREHRITGDNFTIIADGYILIRYKGKEYEYLLELENNKDFNYKKYYRLESEGILVPPIIVCTNRRVYNHCKYLETIKIKLDATNIGILIDDIRNLGRDYGYKINF